MLLCGASFGVETSYSSYPSSAFIGINSEPHRVIEIILPKGSHPEKHTHGGTKFEAKAGR